MQILELRKNSIVQSIAITVTVLVCAVAFIAWGGNINWQLSDISLYTLFPLFGLMAFSLLWMQYMVLAGQKLLQIKSDVLSRYFTVSGWLFLVAIFLHPSLLVWQLWHDGFGLPPESYVQNYVAPGLAWAVLLSTISFLIFISYELRRWFSDRAWWKYMVYASDGAAIAIFVHSTKLGSTLQSGWFQVVWTAYGIILVGCLVYLRIFAGLKNKGRSVL